MHNYNLYSYTDFNIFIASDAELRAYKSLIILVVLEVELVVEHKY